MKKVLLSLTAFSMLASSTATVSCTYTIKARDKFVKSIQKIINVANVSAEAQILTSTNAPNSNLVVEGYKNNSKKINGIEYSTTNANFQYSYLINNFSTMKASQFLPKEDLVPSMNGNNHDDNVKMDRYLFKNYGSDWVDLITSTSIKNNESYKGTKTGSSSITNTASLASSLLGIIFGSDFSTAEAGFLNDNIATLLNQLPGSTKESLAKTLDEISGKVEKLPDISNTLVNPLKKQIGKTKYEAINEISSNFWSSILKKDNAETNEVNEGEIGGTIKTVASVLQYIFTVFWYIQEFADIIDQTVSSDDLTRILTETVDKKDVKNYDQINLNKTFKILNNFLNPGRDTQKAKNLVVVLLGIPTQTNNFKPKSNIIFEPLFKVLAGNSSTSPQTKQKAVSKRSDNSRMFGLNIEQIIKLLRDIIKSNNSLPAGIINELLRLISILQEILASDDKSTFAIIQTVINEAVFRPLTEKDKSILFVGDILYYLADSINQKNGKVVIDSAPFKKISALSGNQNPFGALYDGGLLKSIFQTINYFTTKSENGKAIFSDVVIKNFKDLSSIFNTKMDIIFTQMLNVNYDNNLQFLYGMKNSTIASIVEAISKQFIDPIAGNEYFLDLGAIRKIILSLFNKSYSSIEIQDENVLSSPNNLFATLKVVSAALKNKTVKFDGKEVKDSKAIINVLGLNPENSNQFKKGSIFDSIAQAYGHGVVENDGDNPVEMPEKRENTVKLISTLLEGVSWMSKVSEKAYYDDNFGHFINQNNWTSQIISYTNFDKIHEDAEIKYNLIYKNNKYKIKETYQVTLKRDKTPASEWLGNNYFYVSQIIRK
ncbi:MOLPALP family lipoprotein [Mesoplasma tabanidae]|uniref:MOLPALP family lipoprotein n=1 Tax=Mesoplasma tabanidae TaxID=219745 RepID=A0A2K8P788_9MOLU|nr:MOLPALP family lipoprotein [Mesoplasma tabanidae]ATZ21475.1 MOLPALP family lipoprotein [Mesoplasma tabanidae]